MSLLNPSMAVHTRSWGKRLGGKAPQGRLAPKPRRKPKLKKRKEKKIITKNVKSDSPKVLHEIANGTGDLLPSVERERYDGLFQ